MVFDCTNVLILNHICIKNRTELTELKLKIWIQVVLAKVLILFFLNFIMALLNETHIDNFEQLQKDVVERIKGYGIELTHLSKQLNIDRGLLYRRIKNLDFTPSELRKIVRFLNNPITVKKSES